MAVTDSFVLSVQALTEALRAATTDPADQIRLLIGLCSFTATPLPGTSTIAVAGQTATYATAAVCRRAALSSLANATAAYQPTSSNDVITILQAITPLFDAEILYAADNGDAQSYDGLRDLLQSVVTDLETRSIGLPALLQVTASAVQPVLNIAYAMYADSTRVDDVLSHNPDVPHPLQFPTVFEALSN